MGRWCVLEAVGVDISAVEVPYKKTLNRLNRLAFTFKIFFRKSMSSLLSLRNVTN